MTDTPMTDTPTPATDTPTTGTSARRRMPKRTVFAVAAGSAAIALGVGGFLTTTAAFTDKEVVAGNSIRTASLFIGHSLQTKIAVSDLVPGQEVTTDDVLRFDNGGSVDFEYAVSIENAVGATELLAWVPVTITAAGRTETGTLAAPPTIAGMTLRPGDPLTDIDVTVGLDSNADNSAQSSNASFDLVVNATQK